MLNAETYNAAVSQVRKVDTVSASTLATSNSRQNLIRSRFLFQNIEAGTGSTFLTARRGSWRGHAQLLIIVLCAFALKLFYSTASANQLRWILAPTTALVELVSDTRFSFESHAGYMSSDHTFLIAASCAGVNFLMTSFLMLSLRQLWQDRSQKLAWRFIPVAALVAYLATLVANTFRILISLQLRSPEFSASTSNTLLTPAQLHRLEGVFVYFGFLLLLFLVSEKVICRTGRDTDRLNAGQSGSLSDNEQSRPSRHLSSLLRHSLFPLLIYYATTLALPLANAAYRSGTAASDFWEHLAFVLATPLLLIIPLAAFQLLRSQRLDHEVSSTTR